MTMYSKEWKYIKY